MLGVTYKSAWFMCHRIREAMSPKTVWTSWRQKGRSSRADEKVISAARKKNKHVGKAQQARNIGGMGKQAVFALVERDGNVAFVPHRQHYRQDVTSSLIVENVSPPQIFSS